MEFSQAFAEWSQAHRAAVDAEVVVLKYGLGQTTPEIRQDATQLRLVASQKLRVMLSISAITAIRCQRA